MHALGGRVHAPRQSSQHAKRQITLFEGHVERRHRPVDRDPGRQAVLLQQKLAVVRADRRRRASCRFPGRRIPRLAAGSRRRCPRRRLIDGTPMPSRPHVDAGQDLHEMGRSRPGRHVRCRLRHLGTRATFMDPRSAGPRGRAEGLESAGLTLRSCGSATGVFVGMRERLLRCSRPTFVAPRRVPPPAMRVASPPDAPWPSIPAPRTATIPVCPPRWCRCIWRRIVDARARRGAGAGVHLIQVAAGDHHVFERA